MKKPKGARKYLEHGEVTALLKAAKCGRYPQRDQTLTDVAYRHGLRVSELVAVRWDQINLKATSTWCA